MNFINGASDAAGNEKGALGPGKSKNSSSFNNSEEAVGTATTHQSQPATAGSSSQSNKQGASGAQGAGTVPCFPNGSQSLQFEEFIDIIKDSCTDPDSAENYLVFAFSMFDREK